MEDLLVSLRSETAPEGFDRVVLARLGLIDRYFSIDTPIGPAFVAHNKVGVSAVMRRCEATDFERWFEATFARQIVPDEVPPPDLTRQLRVHLEGGKGRVTFDLRGLSEFERAVLLKALEIPRGEVRPYGWVAREIGRSGAVRAVGTALAHNPVPLFIPCHRVVRSDGTLGNYSMGGIDIKRALLQWEGLRLDTVDTRDRVYVGSDTTHVFCFPSCRYARRVTPAHVKRFRSGTDARRAGYRPCKVCRPA